MDQTRIQSKLNELKKQLELIDDAHLAKVKNNTVVISDIYSFCYRCTQKLNEILNSTSMLS